MAKKIVKWNDGMYITAYDLAKQGLSDNQIAQVIGASGPAFLRWKKKRPYLVEAMEKGRLHKKKLSQSPMFHEYVFERLPPQLQELWEEIRGIERAGNDAHQLEELLSQHGKRARQHLFIHALVTSNFQLSTALRRVNTSKSIYDSWIRNEPEFAKLLEEIQWHKKNFFEDCLVQLVAEGNPQAVVFAAKTQLKDRGYNEKIDVNVQQNIDVTVTQKTINVLELNLPLATRRRILSALRRKNDQPDNNGNRLSTIDHN